MTTPTTTQRMSARLIGRFLTQHGFRRLARTASDDMTWYEDPAGSIVTIPDDGGLLIASRDPATHALIRDFVTRLNAGEITSIARDVQGGH